MAVPSTIPAWCTTTDSHEGLPYCDRIRCSRCSRSRAVCGRGAGGSRQCDAGVVAFRDGIRADRRRTFSKPILDYLRASIRLHRL